MIRQSLFSIMIVLGIIICTSSPVLAISLSSKAEKFRNYFFMEFDVPESIQKLGHDKIIDLINTATLEIEKDPLKHDAWLIDFADKDTFNAGHGQFEVENGDFRGTFYSVKLLGLNDICSHKTIMFIVSNNLHDIAPANVSCLLFSGKTGIAIAADLQFNILKYYADKAKSSKPRYHTRNMGTDGRTMVSDDKSSEPDVAVNKHGYRTSDEVSRRIEYAWRGLNYINVYLHRLSGLYANPAEGKEIKILAEQASEYIRDAQSRYNMNYNIRDFHVDSPLDDNSLRSINYNFTRRKSYQSNANESSINNLNAALDRFNISTLNARVEVENMKRAEQEKALVMLNKERDRSNKVRALETEKNNIYTGFIDKVNSKGLGKGLVSYDLTLKDRNKIADISVLEDQYLKWIESTDVILNTMNQERGEFETTEEYNTRIAREAAAYIERISKEHGSIDAFNYNALNKKLAEAISGFSISSINYEPDTEMLSFDFQGNDFHIPVSLSISRDRAKIIKPKLMDSKAKSVYSLAVDNKNNANLDLKKVIIYHANKKDYNDNFLLEIEAAGVFTKDLSPESIISRRNYETEVAAKKEEDRRKVQMERIERNRSPEVEEYLRNSLAGLVSIPQCLVYAEMMKQTAYSLISAEERIMRISLLSNKAESKGCYRY